MAKLLVDGMAIELVGWIARKDSNTTFIRLQLTDETGSLPGGIIEQAAA